MTQNSDPSRTGADGTTNDETQAKHPLSHLFATVEHSVNEIRTGEISPYDVRAQARARSRGQNQVWLSIRSPRHRGPR